MTLLSVIISNRNDISMLAVTVRSCIEEFQALEKGTCEIVVCDNSDEKIYELVKAALPLGYCRDSLLCITRQSFPCLFSAREQAAQEAKGEFILCLDSHMLCGRNSIGDLLNFMLRHKEDPTLGFVHAPVSWAHQHESRAKHDRDMTRSELGPWGTQYNEERTITWKGMPWICRRNWFLDRDKGLNGYGALARHRVSWGGGDMHLGIKPWLLGFKNWAVPCRPFIHIGPFPKLDTNGNPNHCEISSDAIVQDKYRLYSSSGEFPHTFGFLVSCYILGGEPMMQRNKGMLKERFGRYIDIEKWWSAAKEIGEEEKQWLDARKVMTFEQLLDTKPWN